MEREITIRQTTMEDIPRLKEIFSRARAFMARTGNPNQWPETYPSDTQLKSDIESGDSRVFICEGRIIGTFLLRGGIDPTYNVIEEGAWLDEKPYGTIHRIASSGEIKGLLHLAVEYAAQQYGSIRIDTHRENTVMQKALQKEGFTYCGIIYCWNGEERLAYQRSN